MRPVKPSLVLLGDLWSKVCLAIYDFHALLAFSLFRVDVVLLDRSLPFQAPRSV